MKAISLHQPWATAMALGIKQNETRSRPFYYNGDLAICSTKQKISSLDAAFYAGLARHLPSVCFFPYGTVVCVVRMIECVPSEVFIKCHTPNPAEAALGDYGINRFIYRTDKLRKISSPIPVKGRQFIFNLPPEIEAQILQQL